MGDVRRGSLEIVVQILFDYDWDICLSTQQMRKTLSGSAACRAPLFVSLHALGPQGPGDDKIGPRCGAFFKLNQLFYAICVSLRGKGDFGQHGWQNPTILCFVILKILLS